MGFVITARGNERIRQARGLMQAKARRERGLHLIEGEKLVLEAAQSGCALSELFVEDGYGLPEPLSALSGLVQPVSRSVMESLCSSTTPQHLCAVVKTPELTPLHESDRKVLLEGLDGVISQTLQDKIWEMIWKRWCAYEDFCNSR